MKVSRFVFNMFGVNTYVVWDPESLEAAIIDPGMIDDDERRALDSFIESRNLKVTQLINTHSHLDHIFGNTYIKEKYGLEIKANPADDFLARTLPEQAARFGLRMPLQPQQLDVELHDGDTIFLGKERMEVLGVPGHSPGGIALYCPESNFVITGDTLFPGSMGRTDLPMGDYATLVDAIRRKLLTLPDSTVVLSGHGGETTIGNEKKSNPFLK
ncbi:MBL fold metallo-hydrolase [uncultured Duncaniella sp.]|uniref:MBL fold metallo-hydrolase n=2 Tax=uncultured Duncaniella sp. TaxID=2768039 RepID=UPI0025D5E933|nr:MBL fold metallo-hydrolase [uncultured Duncaniella sp.]